MNSPSFWIESRLPAGRKKLRKTRLAPAQVEHPVVGDQFDEDRGVALDEIVEQAGKIEAADPLHAGDAHRTAGFRAFRPGDAFRNGGSVPFHPLCKLQQMHAGFGEVEAVPAAREQGRVEGFLEFPDAAADGGVVDLKTGAGADQAFLAGDLEKEDDVIPVVGQSLIGTHRLAPSESRRPAGARGDPSRKPCSGKNEARIAAGQCGLRLSVLREIRRLPSPWCFRA